MEALKTNAMDASKKMIKEIRGEIMKYTLKS